MKFVAVGDNCIDWYFLQNEGHVGGCSVNVSVYWKQLGAESAYIGIVGNDENGQRICDGLRERGVDVSRVHVVEGATAVTKIELVKNDRTFRGYDEGVLALPYVDEKDIEYIRSCDVMQTSVYGNCQNILERVEDDVIIGYDFAYKLNDPTVDLALAHIHYGFFSYEQDDDFIREYLKNAWVKGGKNLKYLVATLGSEGSLAYDGKEFVRFEIEPVKPVDTMGAGDSFIAGFLYGAAQGGDILTCMKAGSEKARQTVLVEGAF